MKRCSMIAVVGLVGALMTGCLGNRLSDSIDDMLKTDGDVACEDVWDDLLSSLDSCRGGTLLNGTYSSEAAEEYCEDNCDDLHKEVSDEKVYECSYEISLMDCDELQAAYDNGGDLDVNDCEWLDARLDC
jgi:hypothetical protein